MEVGLRSPECLMPNAQPPQPKNEIIREIVTPDPSLEPFTCPWAKDGLLKALNGFIGSSTGVQGYGIGTRWVRYANASQQKDVVDYWNRLVEYYCGASPFPAIGQDTACRIILRDV